MSTAALDGRFDYLAVGAGAFLVLVGLGTLVGMPWQYSGGGAVTAAANVLGSLASIVVGAGLAWLVYNGE